MRWYIDGRNLAGARAREVARDVSGEVAVIATAIRGMSARAALGKPGELVMLLGAVEAHCGGH